MNIDTPIKQLGITDDSVDTTANPVELTRVNTKNPNFKGRPGTTNIHSKYPSSIAKHLKAIGIDWIPSFGRAIQKNDKALLTIWLRLLPYLIVTAGHRKPRKLKGRASRAALNALAELEGR